MWACVCVWGCRTANITQCWRELLSPRLRNDFLTVLNTLHASHTHWGGNNEENMRKIYNNKPNLSHMKSHFRMFSTHVSEAFSKDKVIWRLIKKNMCMDLMIYWIYLQWLSWWQHFFNFTIIFSKYSFVYQNVLVKINVGKYRCLLNYCIIKTYIINTPLLYYISS